MSRRRLLAGSGAIGLAALLAASSQALAASSPAPARPAGAPAPLPREPVPGAHGALGANFNELIAEIDVTELELGRATWVRGFVPVRHDDDVPPADNPDVRRIVELGDQGYRTVLSLKFPYGKAPLPAPDSPEMAAVLAQLDRTLEQVMGRVDILVVGNEPFIDTRPEDRTEVLNVFHEAVARRVIAHRAERCGADCRTRLYMGALNRLDLPDRHTPAAERWMGYVRRTPEIDGVDIHPHLPSPEATQPFLDYILPRMRADQTFLVTEFSLVWVWGSHLEDPVAAEFTSRYGFPAGTLVWEVVRAAIDDPFPQEQWDAFLAACPWFEGNKHFLRDQMALYRDTGRLAVATYGYRQGAPMVTNWGPDKAAWLFNSVFAPYTVRSWPDGTTGRGYAWIEDFRALQSGR